MAGSARPPLNTAPLQQPPIPEQAEYAAIYVHSKRNPNTTPRVIGESTHSEVGSRTSRTRVAVASCNAGPGGAPMTCGWKNCGLSASLEGCGTMWKPVATLSRCAFQNVPATDATVTLPGRYRSASAGRIK